MRSCRSAGARTRKVAMVSSPRRLISKDWRWFCPPRAPAKNWRWSRPSRQCFKKGRWPRPSCHLPRPADTTTPGLPLLTLSSARRLSEAHMDIHACRIYRCPSAAECKSCVYFSILRVVFEGRCHQVPKITIQNGPRQFRRSTAGVMGSSNPTPLEPLQINLFGEKW